VIKNRVREKRENKKNVRKRETKCVCLCVCVCVRERERIFANFRDAIYLFIKAKNRNLRSKK
jgi:hypothetical protein